MFARSRPESIIGVARRAGAARVQRLTCDRLGLAWTCALILAVGLAGCGRPTPGLAPGVTPEITRVGGLPGASPAPTLSPGGASQSELQSPPTPTLTPEPLAATVNGEAIHLAAYERELARCQAGKRGAGFDPSDCPRLVLQSLIDQTAVEQAAAAAGIAVLDADLETALAQIKLDMGGPEAYADWLTANLYTEDEFRDALQRDLLRARMVEQVTAHIGDRAEQVHARELLVPDEATAQALLAQIKLGADFAALAVAHSLDLSSRPAGGDLGWFPRGLLTVPEVEQAAFALQPGETSDVIRSRLGYHIVQTLEHDLAHPLSPGAAQALRTRAYQEWLEHALAAVRVEQFINP